MMIKPHRQLKPATKHVGDPSSKYGYDSNGLQFEADIRAHIERGQMLWDAFVKFMQDQRVDPREFRNMFMRYYEEFIQ